MGAAVGFAVGAAVGLAALPEGLLLEVLELLGFAVAAGFGVAVALALPAVLLSVLLSGFGVAVGLAVAVVPAEGAAVGFADAVIARLGQNLAHQIKPVLAAIMRHQRFGLTRPQYRPSIAKSWSGSTSIGA